MDIEQQVSKSINAAIQEVIEKHIGGYNSPLQKMVNDEVERQGPAIRAVLKDAIQSVVAPDTFKQQLRDQFTHTLARNLLNSYSGEIDKQANALKQQADFRARVVIAIEQVVKDIGNN